MCWQCRHIQWRLLGWLLTSLHAACSMCKQCQHTLDLAKLAFFAFFAFFGIFWQESLFNRSISNHLPMSSFAYFPICPGYSFWSLPTAVLDDTVTHFGGFVSSFMVTCLLNFTELRHVSFWPVSTVLTLQITFKLFNPSCPHQFTC